MGLRLLERGADAFQAIGGNHDLYSGARSIERGPASRHGLVIQEQYGQHPVLTWRPRGHGLDALAATLFGG
jgi:hypothetical protein